MLLRSAGALQISLPPPTEIIRQWYTNKDHDSQVPSVVSNPSVKTPITIPKSVTSTYPLVHAPSKEDKDSHALKETNLPSLASDYRTLVQLFADHRELILHHHLYHDVQLVHMESGKLILHITKQKIPPSFTTHIATLLNKWTNQPWSVTLSTQTGMPTLDQQDHETVLHHPIVKTVFDAFPGSCIGDPHYTSSQESALDQMSNDAIIPKDHKNSQDSS